MSDFNLDDLLRGFTFRTSDKPAFGDEQHFHDLLTAPPRPERSGVCSLEHHAPLCTNTAQDGGPCTCPCHRRSA